MRASLPPTHIELKLARDRDLFAPEAKYPLREHAVLSPEQLAATRAQLGAAAPALRLPPGALTPEQLAAARAAAGYGARSGGM